MEGGEITVGIDPGFTAGAGDVGIALFGGAANAGPETAGDRVGDEFGADDLIGLDLGEERIVGGFAIGPAEDERDGHVNILIGCEWVLRR